MRKTRKEYNNGRWTRARYFGFIRSALRSASRKWQPIHDARKAARRPYHGPNKRRKWEYQCAVCGKWFAGKEVQVDHIEPVGTLKRYDDLPAFVERLFCEQEGLRVVCKPCHEDRKEVDSGKVSQDPNRV